MNSADRLRLEGVRVRLPNRAAPLLAGLDFSLPPSRVAGLVGASGCGKTTLLHTITGLLPWLRPAEVSGAIELDGEAVLDLDPDQRAHLLACCLDRAFTQLFLARPRDEIAAARRLYGEAPLLDTALDLFGLRPLLDRRTTELSSGERQRLSLALSLAACPRPILLDEPSAHLDGNGIAALAELLQLIPHHSGSALVAEHAGWRFTREVHTWWNLEEGTLHRCEDPSPSALPRPAHEPGADAALRLDGLSVDRDGRTLLRELDLELQSGEIVLISGPNGAGKSTLAEVLAGFRRPAGGRVEAGGPVSLMLPSAELQLFAPTVAEEVATAGGRAAQARVLRRHGLEHLAARAPWTLSRGERQRLVHAALDLQQPPIMVVDEPAQGLDREGLRAFVNLIHRRAERGRAYLIISHREEMATAAHRHLRVENRRLRPC